MSDLTLRDFYALLAIDHPEDIERAAQIEVAHYMERGPGNTSLSLHAELLDISIREKLMPLAATKGLASKLEEFFEARNIGIHPFGGG